MIACETRAEIEHLARMMTQRRPRTRDFEPTTYVLGLMGKSTPAPAYIAAVQSLQLTARVLAPFFESHDLLLTPTLAAPPIPTGALQPTRAERRQMADVVARSIERGAAGFSTNRFCQLPAWALPL